MPEQNEQEAPILPQDQKDDFNAGFDLDEDSPPEGAGKTAEGPAKPPKPQEEEGKLEEPVLPQEQVPPLPQEAQEGQPEVRTVEIPDNIRGEYDRLRLMNPAAAALAAEDSEEGKAVRARLDGVGAESAEDKALILLERRQREIAQKQAMESQVREHNARFLATLKQEVPEYFNLMQTANADPAKRVQAQEYLKSINEWIADKPYREAAPLMEIVQRGRDPHQIAALVKRFESERKTVRAANPQPDPTALLRMPSRGGGLPPAGIGDKNDFDAGFYLDTKQ